MWSLARIFNYKPIGLVIKCPWYDIFNEVFLDDLEKYNLTDFETNLITAIINEPVDDPTFISYLGSDEDSGKESERNSGEESEGESEGES